MTWPWSAIARAAPAHDGAFVALAASLGCGRGAVTIYPLQARAPEKRAARRSGGGGTLTEGPMNGPRRALTMTNGWFKKPNDICI